MPMTTSLTKTRNSAIEALRILAMLLIVVSHSAYHGGFPQEPSNFYWNNFFLDFMLTGNLGVDLYIMISGYFLCEKTFRPVSLCKLLTQVWFYSLLGYGIYLLCGYGFALPDLRTVLLPTLHKSYWFFTAYFVLLWLSPYLNFFVEKADRKQLLGCIVTMVVLWCGIRSLNRQTIHAANLNMYGETMPQFVLFYLLGAYFRKYPENLLSLPRNRYLLALGSFLLMLLSIGLYRRQDLWAPRLDIIILFQDPLSIFTVGTAVGLFAVAVNWKPFVSKTVNLVASCTFGVYLLHDNPFVRGILWLDWVKNYEWFHSVYLLPRMGLSVLAIFAVCCAVEWLRQKTVEKPMTRAAETVFGVLASLVRRRT